MARERSYPNPSDLPITPDLMEPLRRLTKDLKSAAQTLGPKEARFLVDLYYQVQDYRVRAAGQVRSSVPPEEDEDSYEEPALNGEALPTPEPNQLLSWVFESMERLENDIKRALDAYVKHYASGRWMQSIVGIGPVISAGILSQLDIRKSKTVGHFWRFAGLDPTSVWPSKEDAKKLIASVVAEEKDKVFTPQEAVNLYANYARGSRAWIDTDLQAAERLFSKYGAKLVRAVIPTLARVHNRDGIKNLQIKDFERQFQNAVQFYQELIQTKRLVENPEDQEVVDLNLVRIIADKMGRNVFNLYKMAQRKDKKGLDQPPTLDSLAKAVSKRPWNADLKRLMFLAGDCFVKVQNNPNDLYGKIYVERKKLEIEKNARGEFADQADKKLRTTKIGKDTDAILWYSGCFPAEIWNGWTALSAEQRKARMKRMQKAPGQGVKMLPPAHIHMRALRYASKLFLSHVHHVMYVDFFKEDPPAPYVFGHVEGDHRHFIPIPNFPWTGGGAPLKDLLEREPN